jgi:hypothetical protein
MNIAYGHLSKDLRHAGCQDKCVDGCGWLALERWLEGPVTKSDELADERFERRKLALLRGDIPT